MVEGNRLVRRDYDREVFWATRDGKLALAVGLPREGGGFAMMPVVIFTKATGSAAELAAEFQGRLAEPTIQRQVTVLMEAVGEWAVQHGGSFPPRAALRSGGAFWRWKDAPRLMNAITGGPMVLGSEAGNFDFTSTGSFRDTFSYSISVHRGYGLPDAAESESGC